MSGRSRRPKTGIFRLRSGQVAGARFTRPSAAEAASFWVRDGTAESRAPSDKAKMRELWFSDAYTQTSKYERQRSRHSAEVGL